MKIQLTMDEAKTIIKRQFIAHDNVEIEILDVPESSAWTKPLKNIILDIESLNYRTTQNIQAIKRLRELIPGMGLADAKAAIDNWDDWKKNAEICYRSVAQLV